MDRPPRRPRAPDEAARGGAISEQEEQHLSTWIDNGYVVLPQAVPHATLDALDADLDRVWSERDPRIQVELGGVYHPVTPGLREQRYKVLDLYVHSAAARAAAFAPAVRRFLQLVFERDVLLFQGLSFETGSGQPLHQDTAYVVVGSPLEFAAVWIAIEDHQPGSGELEYYRGSHRMPDFLFRGGYKNWNRERDGDALHERYLASVHERAQAAGLDRDSFRPKKGDALVWSADLAHGGAAISDPRTTRKSFVGHYCPLDVQPYYFTYQSERRAVQRHGDGCHYSSSYYPLVG